MTTMTDLLLPGGSAKYKEQVQKLLESQPAVKKDRAGELALGNSFSACLDEELSPGSGFRLGAGRLKNWVRGVGAGEMDRGRRGSGPGKRNFTSTRVIFFHFLCFFFFFSFFWVF